MAIGVVVLGLQVDLRGRREGDTEDIGSDGCNGGGVCRGIPVGGIVWESEWEVELLREKKAVIGVRIASGRSGG